MPQRLIIQTAKCCMPPAPFAFCGVQQEYVCRRAQMLVQMLRWIGQWLEFCGAKHIFGLDIAFDTDFMQRANSCLSKFIQKFASDRHQ